MPPTLLVGFAKFQQIERAARGMQGVLHQVVRVPHQLQLNAFVQLVARFGLHQAGVGRIHQGAELGGGDAELALAARVEK